VSDKPRRLGRPPGPPKVNIHVYVLPEDLKALDIIGARAGVINRSLAVRRLVADWRRRDEPGLGGGPHDDGHDNRIDCGEE